MKQSLSSVFFNVVYFFLIKEMKDLYVLVCHDLHRNEVMLHFAKMQFQNCKKHTLD